jgi:hypothetical protein
VGGTTEFFEGQSMAISLENVHGTCKRCGIDQRPNLHKVIGQNGGEKFTWVCSSCKRQGCFSDGKPGSKPFYIPNQIILANFTREQIDALSVIMPDAINRCVRCGNRKSELHHWAPKEIFGKDEAESWPKDHLCVPCHLLWHDTIKALRSK